MYKRKKITGVKVLEHVLVCHKYEIAKLISYLPKEALALLLKVSL